MESNWPERNSTSQMTIKVYTGAKPYEYLPLKLLQVYSMKQIMVSFHYNMAAIMPSQNMVTSILAGGSIK